MSGAPASHASRRHGPAERARRFLVRTGAMARKETWHVVRDPANLYLALGMPVVLLVIFGYGVSFDLDHVPVAVVDQDGTAASRDLLNRVVDTGELDAVAVLASPEGADRLFQSRAATAAVVVPRGFQENLARGGGVPVQLLLDGSDGTSAMSVLGTASAMIRAATPAVATGPTTVAPPLRARVRLLYNPDLRSAVFLVPGLIAYVLVIAAVLLTALTIAREWERGTMEQLFTTPVGRLEVILGKLAPYLGIGLLQALLVLAVGVVIFDVPIRGSLVLLAGGTLLFLAGALAQGLLVSVVTRNQQLATQVGAVSSLLPGVLLSGFVFPIANMPWPLQVIASIFPARYYVELLRGVLLKDQPVSVLWPQLAALAVFATLMVVLGTARFRRSLD